MQTIAAVRELMANLRQIRFSDDPTAARARPTLTFMEPAFALEHPVWLSRLL
jgi:hypothetical protein